MKRSLSSLSSSPTKRAKLHLRQGELDLLNVKLNQVSRVGLWPQRFQLASHVRDPSMMTTLLSVVLGKIVGALVETSAKDSVISRMFDYESYVGGFSSNERQEWEDGLKTCMRRSDWTDLVTHSKLRNMSAILDVDRTSSETMSERAMRLHSMFGRKYQGDFQKVFVEALKDYEKIYDPRINFGRVIPIIQSSGTGKSRMVREIGNEVPTLSICFRRNLLPESGWPPSDAPVRDFLLGERPHNKRFKGEELAAAFLGAVIAVVAEKLEARGDDSPQKGEWMSDWRLDSAIDILDSRRHTYFTEVAAKAENLLLGHSEAIIEMRATLDPQATINSALVDYIPVWHKRLFEMLCKPYFEKLSQILEKLNVKWFLLAIDECSDLNSCRGVTLADNDLIPPWGMSLIALQCIMKAYDDFVAEVRVWFLLLDTDTSVVNLTPLGKDASSSRYEKRLRSLPPWPYVGFNQMAKKGALAPDKKSLPTDVHVVQHLKFYGRPYWSTLSNHEVLGVARHKLFSGDGFRADQEEHVFAAFAVRVGLETSVGQASERLAMDAVRSHMRILEGVVGSTVTTSAPEPMFAIVAAVELNHSEEAYKTALETLLNKLILKGVVLDRGELSIRLLLLRARDKAGKGCVDIDPISNEPKVQPVALSTFLQTLLGDTLGLPDNQRHARENLLHEASSVWLNFTHFYQMPLSIDEVTESMLVNAWSSGAGIQCAHNQLVIGGFLVGYRGSPDEPFQRSNLLAIPWRSNISTSSALALADSLTAPFIVPQDGGNRYKPWHVVILMNLAAPSAFGNASTATGPHCNLSCARAIRPESGEEAVWKSYAETDESEGQRYCLEIRGHRAKNYYPALDGVESEFDTLFMRALNCPVPEFVRYAEMMAKANGCMILD